MKKILSILFFLVLLYACNNVANQPADINLPAAKIPIDNLQLARTAALTIAGTAVGTTGLIDGLQELEDYIFYGLLTGSATLNGVVNNYAGYETTYNVLTDVDMDFSGYSSRDDLTIADGSLLVTSYTMVGPYGASVRYDIAGTIDVSGTINGETFNDTIILDFEWDDDNFFTGTLTNGDGIVFNL